MASKHTHSDYFICLLFIIMASLVAQMVKSLPAMQETQVQSLGQEGHLEMEMAITPELLAGKFHGERGLAGYSPRGAKGLNMTEPLTNKVTTKV